MTAGICLLSLVQSLLIVTAVSAAPDPKLAPITEIKGVNPKRSVFDAAAKENPVVIRSEKDADKLFVGDDLVKLKKHVDFDSQFILLFAWRGSGQDRLSCKVLESDPEKLRFRLIPGRTRDLRPHVRVYSVRSNVKWKYGRAWQAADDTKGSNLSYVMVTEGIVGGFVPAHVRRRIIIVNHDGKYELLLMKQPTRGDEAIYKRGTLTAEQFSSLSKAIKNEGLFELPVESPPGCQDIYKLDASVMVRTDKTFWRNGGPSGCVRGQSTIQPTKKQQQKFRTVVEFVKSFANEHKNVRSDAKTINATVEQIHRDAPKPKTTP